jgi:DNA polymerase III alpha subunit (gram-positive type)
LAGDQTCSPTPHQRRIMAREVYVSTDIESDGPIPGPHSMLSIGSVAYDDTGVEIASFSANLDTLDGAAGHPDTMAWWQTQTKAWAACHTNPEPPTTVMLRYEQWLSSLPGACVFVGYPVAFDFMFVHWYLHRFVGRSPFSHSALDLKTMAMILLNSRYREATKRHMPRRWFAPDAGNHHVAVDDARAQGALFVSMLKEWRALRSAG